MDRLFLDNFHNKFSSEAYKYLGCHFTSNQHNGKGEVVFRVYSPHALKVSVVGDFNNWDVSSSIMNKIDDSIFELYIPNVSVFDNYKYYITSENGSFFKQDPYSYHNETNLGTCSKVYDVNCFQWSDDIWLMNRSNNSIYNVPINIYEVHLGSWRKHKNSYYSYRDMAKELIPYVKKMGYTHIEIMPLLEHPFEGSWGYQVTGYYSITSRYGTPSDFMYLVNEAHKANIGIIMDWVPAHFPKDSFGLYEFDGEYVYEDPEPTRMEHKSWGTRIFNYGKPEVKSFLISSARFFLEYYHIDGIRVDAVAAMIYLDYDRKEWIPNKYGDNKNLEAISFLQDLNIEMFKNYPNIMMIAEESTDFAKVTHPVYEGGLGFNYKWNMGWMNDTLSYIKIDPFFRRYDHNKMTFSMMYAFSENFILPISHDEVVHGKKSLLDKMPGSYEEKFANLKLYLGYMMTHPGKKLLFMGCEFGQFIEWDYKKELDWFLLKYPNHLAMQLYTSKLNKFYLKHSELWECDDSWEGFKWLNANDADHNMYVYERINKKKQSLIIVLNMSGCEYHNYRIGLKRGSYKEVFNSDDLIYMGKNLCNPDVLKTEKIDCVNSKYSIEVKINKLSILILKKL